MRLATSTSARLAWAPSSLLAGLLLSTPARAQTPYLGAPAAVPGIIQAEHFDTGSPGVAYADTTPGNLGGALRSTNVDILGSGAAHAVSWVQAGEWLRYTVSVRAAGPYQLHARVAKGGPLGPGPRGLGGTFHVEFDGVDATGPIPIPNTFGGTGYMVITKTGLRLRAGQQSMRLVMDREAADGFVGTFDAVSLQGSNPSVDGEWSRVYGLPAVAIHTHVLPTGKVLFWSLSSPAYLWDPVANPGVAPIPIDVPPGNRQPVNNIFCSGHSFLKDGRLLIAGGHVVDLEGTRYTNTYTATITNPPNDVFTQLDSDMTDPRWYPSNCTLQDGRVLTVSGSRTPPNPLLNFSTTPEVWDSTTATWQTLPGADILLPLYPWVFLAPDVPGTRTSQVFVAGPQTATRFLGTAGSGSLGDPIFTKSSEQRDEGSSVMYDTGKVLIVGGDPPPIGQPLATSEIIDLGVASQAWEFTRRPNDQQTTMVFPRRWPNATVLPDGQVVVIGGSRTGECVDADAVLDAELWNPQTQEWSTKARMTVPRLYHSTPVLLPDARVLSAGGGEGLTCDAHKNAEIYSPPYLFQGAAQPVIQTAPTRVGYGTEFEIDTPEASTITAVTWIRLGSVTHAFDQNQRLNTLGFRRHPDPMRPTTLVITPPANATLCPPGHYMLFILRNGVPSRAKIIQIE